MPSEMHLKGQLGLLVLLVLGCASGPIGSLPAIEPGQKVGEVFVVRNKNIVGSANSYYVMLDGHDIFAIRIGQYTKFKLVSGEHHVGVMCFVGWTPTWNEHSLGFHLLPGGRAYFVISPNMSCADIKLIGKDEGERRINASKHVEMAQ